MNILVVHFEVIKNDRNTIKEHLGSFEKYSEHNVMYLNGFLGTPWFIKFFKFDLVIYHYTFLSQKWLGPEHFKGFLRRNKALKDVKGYKIAMPQDEYVFSDLLCEFFKEYKVDSIYTCFYPEDYEKVYPYEKTGTKNIRTNLTGYMDEKTLERISSKFYKPHSERSVDIGYRARKLPFWLGKHGTIKWMLTEKFEEACKDLHLNTDLSNDEKDVFMGDEWYHFLANTRVVLGCEGGASLLDVDGSIREKVNAYVDDNPKANFEEVEEKCFPGLDGNISLFAISPRHFEACMTRTCQVLVEGTYHGIFKPEVHYIELKKDFSNLAEVVEKIKDVNYCERIAERAYNDIILNCQHTYSIFVKSVISEAMAEVGKEVSVSKASGVIFRTFFNFSMFVRIFTIGAAYRNLYLFKKTFFPVLRFFGLVPHYRALRARLYKGAKV